MNSTINRQIKYRGYVIGDEGGEYIKITIAKGMKS